MANNGGHYDPRAQAMEEIHFDWRCIVCCMVALSPLHLKQQHLPGTESVYFDLDNTPWVKCDKCHTPFHLQCGTWESLTLVRNKHFLCNFSAEESFRSRPMLLDYPLPGPPSWIILTSVKTPSENTYSRFTSVSLVLKMAQKQLCPDGSNGTPAKRKRVNLEEPLPKKHQNRQHQNQATQVITETLLTKIRRLGCSQRKL